MVRAELARYFFDSDVVIAAVDAVKRKALSKGGAFVRSDARKSMKRRAKPSPPGQPPRTVRGDIKRLLFFAYEPATESVVVGPAKYGDTLAAHFLEFGGKTEPSRVVRRRSGARAVVIEPRPFMEPALTKNLPKMPAMWANSLKGG